MKVWKAQENIYSLAGIIKAFFVTLLAVATTATVVDNPSATHGFKTVGIWESGDDQNWVLAQGPTADRDTYYFTTASGSLSWSYVVTKDGGPNGSQITTDQRNHFLVNFVTDFATSPEIAARFVVYVNTADETKKGWYSSGNIAGDHGEISTGDVKWRHNAEAALSGKWYQCTQKSLNDGRDGSVVWETLWRENSVESLPSGPITQVGIAFNTTSMADRVAVDNFRVIANTEFVDVSIDNQYCKNIEFFMPGWSFFDMHKLRCVKDRKTCSDYCQDYKHFNFRQCSEGENAVNCHCCVDTDDLMSVEKFSMYRRIPGSTSTATRFVIKEEESCPSGQLITSSADCEVACATLKFKSILFDKYDASLPYGCQAEGTNCFFNTEMGNSPQPSNTKPICRDVDCNPGFKSVSIFGDTDTKACLPDKRCRALVVSSEDPTIASANCIGEGAVTSFPSGGFTLSGGSSVSNGLYGVPTLVHNGKPVYQSEKGCKVLHYSGSEANNTLCNSQPCWVVECSGSVLHYVNSDANGPPSRGWSSGPAAVQGGNVVITHGCTFECGDGYRIVGGAEQASITCNDGNWPIYRPKCEEIPCTVKNSNGKPGRDCACGSGYNGDVTWVNGVSVGTCNPTKCTGSRADAPINGRVDLSDGVNHGSIAVFYCNDGFTQTGVRSIVCDAKDQDTPWPKPSEPFTCTPIPTTTPTTTTTSLPILPTDGTTTPPNVAAFVSDDKDKEDPMFSLDDMIIIAGVTGGVFIFLVGIVIAILVFFVRRNGQRKQRKQEDDTLGAPVTYPRPKSPTSPESHVHSIELVELDNTKDDPKQQDLLAQSSEKVETVECSIEVVEVDPVTNVNGLYLDPLTTVSFSDDGDIDSPMHGLT